MILSVGEILVDSYQKGGEEKKFAGGAPFNVAANAKFCGAMTGFVGKVGNDPDGDFLRDFAQKINFDYLNIARDAVRKTTKAVVKVDEHGERSFTFLRNDTADYHLEISDVPLDMLDEDDIVHVGSLMLSEEAGREFAKKLAAEIKHRRLLLSFDVNLREDIFKDKEAALAAYQPMLEAADILKFSSDEILWFAQADKLSDAIQSFIKPNRLLVITLGADGSMFVKDGKSMLVAPAKVEKVVDTTGAGDAFFGALLYKLDCRNWRAEGESFFADALHFANALGAFCITKEGAINRF
jgi:fructokinase